MREYLRPSHMQSHHVSTTAKAVVHTDKEQSKINPTDVFCKYKKLFQQVLKKWQSHKIPTPPFKSQLISFILLCKSQSHLSTTKTCFPSYTLSLVLASLLQPWHSNLPGLTTHSMATVKCSALSTEGQNSKTTNSLSSRWCQREGLKSPLKSLPVNTDLSGPLSFKAPKLPMQVSFQESKLKPQYSSKYSAFLFHLPRVWKVCCPTANQGSSADCWFKTRKNKREKESPWHICFCSVL